MGLRIGDKLPGYNSLCQRDVQNLRSLRSGVLGGIIGRKSCGARIPLATITELKVLYYELS